MVFFFFSRSFASLFQIKLGTHSSNLISKFVNMNELKFFLLIRVLTQNLNTMDLIKVLEKKSKTSHLYHSGLIEGDIMQNHEQKKSEKSEKPRFYGQNNLFSEHPTL
jgi:hypothetical protein